MRIIAVLALSAALAFGPVYSQCLDCDEDGFLPPLDCDDTNASVFPGAPEQCDSLDNNCDGDIDMRP